MKSIELIEKYNSSERDFHEVDLSGADLSGADLREANLRDANLSGADLREANLRDANLSGADLRGANLRGADLRWANLRGADLPSPNDILLAQWCEVSDELCIDLMKYDASNHPDPSSFDLWKEYGKCPFINIKIQRSANFKEKKELWIMGPAKSAFELMKMLIREKCSDSDYHNHG
jgi:hypothetical protein